MKLAVIFPGIGYHADKPLLYYSKMLAKKEGFEILEVDYGRLPSGAKTTDDQRRQAFEMAYQSTGKQLEHVNWADCERILFLSKSLGTVVAGRYAREHELKTENVYFTPVQESLEVMAVPGIAFHGNRDPLADTGMITEGCARLRIPLYLTEGGSHSLETGDAQTDLQNLKVIMAAVEAFLTGKVKSYDGGQMFTYTGRQIDPLQMRPEDVELEDIAHALSLLCRGCGHLLYPYTVGQHSVNCALEARARRWPAKLALGCLLHDAGEAYLSDIIRPVKRHLSNYADLEERVVSVIWEKFGLSDLTVEEKQKIRQLDDEVLALELARQSRCGVREVLPEWVTEPKLSQQPWQETQKDFMELAEILRREADRDAEK